MTRFHIPANYTDAGKLFGMFAIRNGIEAVIISVPLFFICFANLPFDFTTNLVITLIFVIPLGGFALIGINDDCLSRFIRIFLAWLRNRGVITYKGSERLKGKAVKKIED